MFDFCAFSTFFLRNFGDFAAKSWPSVTIIHFVLGGASGDKVIQRISIMFLSDVRAIFRKHFHNDRHIGTPD